MAQVIGLISPRLPSGKQGLFAHLSQMLANYREYRRIYKELDSLSERELTDIGVSRHNIGDIARAAAYGS